MNILSLFDGMSCGQIALRQLGIPIKKYYASEIDKYAIQQTQHNFPNTIQLGDVENWQAWDINWESIDFVLAGSPCQGFSFAGKQLAFNDPRSKLFFVFIEILNHIKQVNPAVKFLLENVNMKRNHLAIISQCVAVYPVRINSNLVSAQNRDRWYWTNINTSRIGLLNDLHYDIPQPKDRGILLRDIIEKEVDEKYYIKNPKKGFEGMDINSKGRTLRTGGASSQTDKHNCDIIKIDIKGNPKKDQSKASCFTAGANSGGNHSDMDLIVCLTPKRTEYGKQNSHRIRRLTPAECARLQTIPDWYEWIVSDTQIYKMCGNGWTVEVIKHILSFLNK